jgi:hypothetical protein
MEKGKLVQIDDSSAESDVLTSQLIGYLSTYAQVARGIVRGLGTTWREDFR